MFSVPSQLPRLLQPIAKSSPGNNCDRLQNFVIRSSFMSPMSKREAIRSASRYRNRSGGQHRSTECDGTTPTSVAQELGCQLFLEVPPGHALKATSSAKNLSEVRGISPSFLEVIDRLLKPCSKLKSVYCHFRVASARLTLEKMPRISPQH